jgi:hypothetical protein
MTLLQTLHRGASSCLLGIACFLALVNWILILDDRTRRRDASLLPGPGLLAGLAYFALNPSRWRLAWSILLDPGTLMLLAGLPALVLKIWRTGRINLLESHVGRDGCQTVRLNLYRSGDFVLLQTRGRPEGEVGWVALSTPGRWGREGTTLLLHIGVERAEYEAIEADGTPAFRPIPGFPMFEADPTQALAGIVLVRDHEAGRASKPG